MAYYHNNMTLPQVMMTEHIPFYTTNPNKNVFLRSLCYVIWDTSELPASWAVAMFIPIPKLKKVPLHSTNYRPHAFTRRWERW